MPLVWMILGLLVIAAFVAVLAMRFGVHPSASAGASPAATAIASPGATKGR